MQNVVDEDPPFVAASLEKRLRRIADHDQRPVLVRSAKEKILRNLFD
jgi:shikimate kinase